MMTLWRLDQYMMTLLHCDFHRAHCVWDGPEEWQVYTQTGAFVVSFFWGENFGAKDQGGQTKNLMTTMSEAFKAVCSDRCVPERFDFGVWQAKGLTQNGIKELSRPFAVIDMHAEVDACLPRCLNAKRSIICARQGESSESLWHSKLSCTRSVGVNICTDSVGVDQRTGSVSVRSGRPWSLAQGAPGCYANIFGFLFALCLYNLLFFHYCAPRDCRNSSHSTFLLLFRPSARLQ